MNAKLLDIKQIALGRLKALACENLPIPVRERIVADFVTDAERKLDRLARRQITIPKIAKIMAIPHTRGPMSPSVGNWFGDGMDDVSLYTFQVTLAKVGTLMTTWACAVGVVVSTTNT